jgi:predicted SAM-dependent methyltransferase
MHQINTSRSKRLYLYIGCGSDRILNFTHMDYSVAKASKNGVKVKQPEIFGDLRSGIPVLNHSVDLIYTIHTFEHLTVSDLIDVLRNCRNKLKGG